MVIKHPPLSPKYLSSCLVWVMWRAPLRVGPESYRSIETQFPDIFLFFIFWDPIPRRFSFSLRPNFQTYFYSFFLDPISRPISILYFYWDPILRHISILYFSRPVHSFDCNSEVSVKFNPRQLKTSQNWQTGKKVFSLWRRRTGISVWANYVCEI